jgi:hypothetical protein
MDNNRRSSNRNISKGGLIGALAGSVVSSQFQNKNDQPFKMNAKTGFFAALGYLIGTFLEKFFKLDKKG